MNKINALKTLYENKGTLIATHRGMVCGNIPHNTFPAFDVALNHGTDIIETDVTMAGDGELFIFHPRQEVNQLKLDVHINEMTAAEVRELRYVNDCRAATEWGIPTLDEFLERYKGRCLINLDHGWDFFPEMIKKVRAHKMEDQILLKAPATKPETFKIIEEIAPDMMFMPIIKEETMEAAAQLEQMDINYVAAELVFPTEDSPLLAADYIESHLEAGRLLWVNTILYNCQKPLSGGHTDDVAVMGNPDYGWGWNIDKGFHILQTDWTMALKQYLDTRQA